MGDLHRSAKLTHHHPAEVGVRGTMLASRVRASWQRSESYGVSREHVEPVFTGSVDTGSLLYECGLQVLQGLHATLADEPVSLMIADSDGLVLARLCHENGINRSLDRVHLAPGFFFTEHNAGTNGLALSLADRAPTLVRAGEHYCSDLRGYTCAAVPVLDPLTGDLAGTVNLTTWADSSAELLLALAQSAASNTSNLMLLRTAGRRPRPRPAPRGEVTRVYHDRGPASTTDACRSAVWTDALDTARRAMVDGHVVAAVGERGSGKTTLISIARQHISSRERVLSVRPPSQDDPRGWLDLWTPELRHADTCILISGVENLPAWAADEMAATLAATPRGVGRPAGFILTTSDFATIPACLKSLVDTVVEAPPLRRRTDDIMPLARHFARQERRREVVFTPMAARALTDFDWPGNVGQLERVSREAAVRTDIVDSRHLSPEVFGGHDRPLNRLDALKRDEIIRCLTEPGVTVAQAAEKLGMGRATVYRKIAEYDIRLPGRSR